MSKRENAEVIRMAKLVIDNSSLHSMILSCIIERGFAPSINELCEYFSASREDIVQGLAALADYHGVVLHPKTSEVWAIHPFSLAPTLFWLETSKGKYWTNCAWCSLGAAALLESDVTITTTLGGEAKQVKLEIIDGELRDKDIFVHFPVPMTQCWDNVIYTCSVMCLFDSENAVDAWCTQHKIPKGDVQPIEKIWRFARAWYQNHLNPDWKKWTSAEAKALFQEFELTGPIWNIEETDGRF
jgi:hypothetical protein